MPDRWLGAVWGTSASDVYAVGGDGAILHYDGATWSPMASGTKEYLVAVRGTSPSDVVAAGGDGTLVHFDGTAWQPLTSGTETQLASVWGTSSGDVHVVGGGRGAAAGRASVTRPARRPFDVCGGSFYVDGAVERPSC